MTPSFVMTIAAISGILALIALFLNFFILIGRGSAIGVVLHVVFGLWAGASWITFLIGVVMFLINYAKTA